MGALMSDVHHDNTDRSKFWVVWCPDARSPTVKHWSKDSAAAEAVRLATANPALDFFVLKATRGFRGTAPNPPAELKMVVDDDGIPF
jgi:hypothetical protein